MDTSHRTVTWSEPEAEQRRGTALDAWARHAWTDGVQVDALEALEVLEVQTRNTRYAITIVDPASGEVLVTGGRFFPVATRARVNGCTLGGSCLKWRGIYAGFLMELQVGAEVVVTTRVQSVERRPAARNSRPH
jgi:hypothetical protein